jgi:hypothetical protein
MWSLGLPYNWTSLMSMSLSFECGGRIHYHFYIMMVLRLYIMMINVSKAVHHDDYFRRVLMQKVAKEMLGMLSFPSVASRLSLGSGPGPCLPGSCSSDELQRAVTSLSLLR